MTQRPRDASSQPIEDGDATDPAMALADVWELLDVLPAATASPDMMATTIEVAAVSAGGMISRTGVGVSMDRGAMTGHGGRPAPAAAWPSVRQWLPGAALVFASLVTGIAMGRATAPTPELAILASLPVVQHLDLLREAGSVAFLEGVARGGYPPPRRPPPAHSKADVREDAQQFDAAIAALRQAGTVTANRETLAARREEVLQMPDAQRRQLERSAETFQRLPGGDRSELVALGRALADPGREQLLEAARLWHSWMQLRDPADRRDVIELSAKDRLEWLDRWTRIDSRLESRQDGRDPMRPFFDRERDNRRRPPPDFRPGPPEFRQGPPEFRQGPPEFRQGPPDFQPGPPDFRQGPPPEHRPGMRGPPVIDREPPPPAETEAPPR
jgi:hypothetical protein